VNRDPELVRQIREHPWFHTMKLDDDLATKGDSPERPIMSEPGVIPDVRGKSVLDIGAWDGKYSFQAEAAGASRVVALDHYVWKLDPAARQAYYEQCAAEGLLPDPDMIDRGFLVDEGLPGKRGFDLAHAFLESQVEAVADDFMFMDLDDLGTFDVVLYFGVLYHMVNPIEALMRVRKVTEGVAVIETSGIYVAGNARTDLVGFYAGNELNSDFGNWFAPSDSALVGMCRSAGFRRATIAAKEEVLPRKQRLTRLLRRQPVPVRLIAHAFAE
jgi:tRNA (mo5U34)-methyltransferase